ALRCHGAGGPPLLSPLQLVVDDDGQPLGHEFTILCPASARVVRCFETPVIIRLALADRRFKPTEQQVTDREIYPRVLRATKVTRGRNRANCSRRTA